MQKRLQILWIVLDFSLKRYYNNGCRENGPESILDLAGCVGGREINV